LLQSWPIYEKAPQKPTHWYRYVDNTCMDWFYGKEELGSFQKHFDNIHPSIRFSMKTFEDILPSSLGVLVKRTPDKAYGVGEPHCCSSLFACLFSSPLTKHAVLSALL
jgi:hypothetical protein